MINALRRMISGKAIIIIIALGAAMLIPRAMVMIPPATASILLVATAVGVVIIWRPEIGFLLMVASLGVENMLIGVPVTIFRMLGVLTFGSWLVREFLAKRLSFTKTPQNLYLAGFIFTAILSIFFANVSSISLVRVTTFVQLVFLYLLAIGLVTTEKILRQVVWVWVISAVATSLFAITMFMQGELPRAIGGIGDPNYLVLYLLIPTALAGYLFQREKAVVRRIFLGMFLGIFLIVTVISFSRGGFVAMMVVLLFMFLKTKRKKNFVVFLVFHD